MKIKDLVLPTAATSLILLNACGGDEEKAVEEMDDGNDLLIGDWKVISRDGRSAISTSEGYEYYTLFKFEADGDFRYCFASNNPNSGYEQCYEGDWEWIEIDQSFDFSFTERVNNEEFLSQGNAQLTQFEGDEMVATIERTQASGTVEYEYVFEKQ